MLWKSHSLLYRVKSAAYTVIRLLHICRLTLLLDYFSQEEKQKAYKREKKKDRKRKADDASLHPDIDPEVASMMGFSGFGGSSKNN